MGRGQELLNLVKSIKQEKELQTVQEEIKEVIKPENLKAGVTAFGVEGNKNVVDTSDATLPSYSGQYVHPNYSVYTQGKKIQGSMKTSSSNNPAYFYGTHEYINPEDPYFILIYQYASGTIRGDILRIKNTCIDPSWIEGKNIALRCNVLENGKYNVQLDVTEWGNQFQFCNSSGEFPIFCKGPDGKGSTYTTYYCNNIDNLDSITPSMWKSYTVTSTSSYDDGPMGDINKVYCYSRDASVRSTGLTGSSGIPKSSDKIYLKKKVNLNAQSAYVDGYGYTLDIIDQATIANAINLKPENIKKGETYLGVEGTMPDNNAMIKTSVAQQGSSSQILHCIEYLPDDLYVDSSTAQYLFAYMSSLKALPKNLNLSKVTQANYMCFRCYALEGNIKINVNNLTSVMDMFADCKLITSVEYFPTTANMFTELFDGCINLVEIPELNTANAAWSGMINPFRNCPKLSDNSLNNILAMCTKATAIAEAKTYANLKSTGLSQEQAAKCQTLSNWDAFVAAGWTTGYTELDTVTEE